MHTPSSLSPQEGLDLIRDTIAKTKDDIRAHSFLFLLWGWLITIASMLHFMLFQYTNFDYYFIGWPVLTGSGILVSLLYISKQMAHSATETYLSFFLRRMWLVLGICFMLTVIVSLLQQLLPFTYTLIIAGFGTTISGLVLRFVPLTLGGIFFLTSSLISVFIPGEYKVLLHAVAIIIGYIIPGYLLKNANQ